MELKLENGDYLPDGHGGLQQAGEELLQRVLNRLSARRGSFPFLPDFGSRLYLLGLTAPTADLAAGATVLPVLGTLTIAEMEG